MPHLKYTYLLVSLLLLFLISPLFEELDVAKIIISIFLSAVLVSAVYAVSQNKGLFVFSILLLCPALVGNWSIYFVESLSLELMGRSFSALFLAFAAISMMNHVFREDHVTADTVAGAICVYLLIGLTWAYLYSVTELLLPGSFIFGPLTTRSAGSLVHDKSSLFFYYSFVTLTTLGYGDITPITPPARSLSMLEAVTGPVYLTVLVARLVALHISHSGQDKPR
jgi:hypothetical protein